MLCTAALAAIAEAKQDYAAPGLLREDEFVFLLYHPGANQGHGLLVARWMPAFLGPNCHALSLDEGGIEKAMQLMQEVQERARQAHPTGADLPPPLPLMRIVVAGGDGSVVRVLSALKGTAFSHVPLATVPLGTGNDMSGLLGWGVAAPDMSALLCQAGMRGWLRDLRAAETIQHDMWTVDFSVQESSGAITQVRSGAVTTLPQSQLSLPCINYTSLGMDARLVHAVELHRLGSRFLNRMVYGAAGCITVATPSMPVTAGIRRWSMAPPGDAEGASEPDASFTRALELDASAVGTYHTLMFLNAHSYGGGCPLWKLATQLPRSRYEAMRAAGDAGQPWPLPPRELSASVESDGILEVLGSSTLLQLGWTTMTHVNFVGGLHQLAKASGARLQFSESFRGDLPLQVDGEAYILKKPAAFSVRLTSKASVLRRRGFKPIEPWLGQVL